MNRQPPTMQRIDSGPADMLTVRDYAEILRRRARMVVGAALLVALVAAAATGFSRTTYTANVELLVQQPAEEGDVLERALLGNTDLATQRQIVTSIPVAERVARELGLSTEPAALRQLTDRLAVGVVGETSVMSLTAQHEDPDVAARLPQAFADAYMAYQRDVAGERITAAREDLEQQQEAVESEIESVNEQLQEATGEEVDALRSQREQLAARLNAIETQLVQLEVGDELLFTGQVISPATVPQERSLQVALARNVGLGLLLGAALGAALAFVREWVEDRVVRPADVSRGTGQPVLGSVPIHARLPVDADEGADGEALEAYRSLRATVQAVTLASGVSPARGGEGTRQPPPSVLVAAADAGSPSGLVAANLAVAFSRSGLRVLLADAQPHDGASALVAPTVPAALYDLVGTGDHQQLQQLAAGPSGLPLHAIGSGAADGANRDRLTAPRVHRLLEDLHGMADLVVFDGGPAVAAPEAVALGPAVSNVLLVARWQVTGRTELQEAAQRIRDVRGRLMGTVLCAPSGEESEAA